MSAHIKCNNKKITVRILEQLKQEREKISMLTCYDYTMAKLLDQSGVDCILVGDSASNVVLGNQTTLPITLEEMIFLAKSVSRGIHRAFVVCDMPFGSYQINVDQAVANAIRIMKETGVDAVKLEGGKEILSQVQHIIEAGIPVFGHLGLTPQSVHKFGGYGLRANTEAEAEKLLKDAVELDKIGCSAIVLEKVPANLAKKVTETVNCPTIGIGAGKETDGQVLVSSDMLGMNLEFQPKFLRRYANLAEDVIAAVTHYVHDVKTSSFPNEKESY